MNDTTKWSLANLSLPPSAMFCGDGELTDSHLEWIQDSNLWASFYYHHANAVTYGTRTYGVEAGDMVFYAPGVIAGHAKTGSGTHFDFMAFDLPATTGIRGAIPHVAKGMQPVLAQLRRASNRIADSREPAVAFVWNLLWTVAQSPSLFRESEVLYIAEDYVLRNIQRKFTVGEVAEAAKVSSRTLLNVFREQHGISVQEFVLRRRIQEATRLLLRTSVPVKEVAARVGMPDLQYFNKTVRAMTGMSPTKLRDSQSR